MEGAVGLGAREVQVIRKLRPLRSKHSSIKQIVCADRTRRFTPDQLWAEITEPRIEGLLAECGIGLAKGRETAPAGERRKGE